MIHSQSLYSASDGTLQFPPEQPESQSTSLTEYVDIYKKFDLACNIFCTAENELQEDIIIDIDLNKDNKLNTDTQT